MTTEYWIKEAPIPARFPTPRLYDIRRSMSTVGRDILTSRPMETAAAPVQDGRYAQLLPIDVVAMIADKETYRFLLTFRGDKAQLLLNIMHSVR